MFPLYSYSESYEIRVDFKSMIQKERGSWVARLSLLLFIHAELDVTVLGSSPTSESKPSMDLAWESFSPSPSAPPLLSHSLSQLKFFFSKRKLLCLQGKPQTEDRFPLRLCPSEHNTLASCLQDSSSETVGFFPQLQQFT